MEKKGFKHLNSAPLCVRDGQVCAYNTSSGVTGVCGLKGKNFECIPVKPGSVPLKPPPRGIGSCSKEGQSCPYDEFGSGTCTKNLECIPLPGSGPNNPYNSSSSNQQGIVDICTQQDQPCVSNKLLGSIGKCGKNLECIPPPGSGPNNPYIPVFGKPKPKPNPPKK